MKSNSVHLVVQTVTRVGVNAKHIFKRAYEYSEIRVSRKYLCQRVLDYLHKDTVPQVVEDYCLEIMSHRTETNP